MAIIRKLLDDQHKPDCSLSFLDENGDPQPSHVKQSPADDCDINKIIAKYDQTGILTHVNTMVARYGDFTEANEYQDALNLVIEAQDGFAELPSHIRARFGNDPGTFLEWVTDPSNHEAAVELGLIEGGAPLDEPTEPDPATKQSSGDGEPSES